MQLPAEGRPWSDLKDQMTQRRQGDVKWRDGRTAVYVFNAGEDVETVQKEAYQMFMSENGLGPLAFPSLAAMEQEVISMAAQLLHGGNAAKGAITSGGTDSITMAMKTARDCARVKDKLSGAPNIVLAQSAHLAFDKAAHLMDIEVRRIPIKTDGSYEADVAAMEAACDDGTLMIVGSAPNFPFGVIDPIEALGAVAERKDLWLHVDACVGGYFAPFARMNGAAVPAFDFDVPGVRSMSADLHKYGYAAKGASTVLFRDEELYNFMPFDMSNWSGAPMQTPTLAGTRPGGAIAAAWAVMNYLGVEGYRRLQGAVCATRERAVEGLERMGFKILGRPMLGLVAFEHPDHNAFDLYTEMYQRGWFTSANFDPPSLHLMLSPKHAEVIDEYLVDMEQSLAALTAKGRSDNAGAEVRYS